jgi:hypothetical protein
MAGVQGHVAFVLSPAGDRVFGTDAETGDFADITADLGLSTASHAGALGDFNADERTDLLSWDGERLAVYAQTEEGTFSDSGGGTPVEECLGLDALPAPSDGQGACLVSTTTWPVRVVFENETTRDSAVLKGESAEFPGAGLKQVYSCVVADFDGDTLVDILQPFRAGALFYRGEKGGGFAAPERQEGLFGGFGEMHPYVCDLDADAMLDLVLMGKAGLAVWHNAGEGRFESFLQVGEPNRFVRPDSTGGAVGDLNNDGRQDFMIFYRRGGAQAYFSRGFATFGYGRTLDLAGEEMFPESTQGQRAGLLHDWNGDGAQDLMTVLADGTVWLVRQGTEGPPLLAAELNLGPVDYGGAPVRVVGRIRDRTLGAWNLTPGGPPALFSRGQPGPLKVEVFRAGAGEKETAEIMLVTGPVQRLLP